jgi:hypothetical protein
MAKINAKTTGGGGIETVGDASGVLELQSDGTTRQYIDASGNVGIGTSSPTAKLQVRTSGTGVSQANFTADLGTNNNRALVLTAPSTDSGNEPFTWSTGNSIAFSIDDVERMRIDSNGNVLMGVTTNPNSATLAVSTQLTKTTALTPIISLTATASAASIVSIGTSTAARTHIVFENGATVGSISTNASATTYSTSSDYRLKENIAPMVGALDTVAQLKPVIYTWKIDGSDGQGFIAHELQEVVPDCVTGEKDAVDAEGNPEYQGVDTSFLVATLTAAIQEQQAIITDLKARIEALENSNGID